MVDEGPGLSGSSFASVADALESIGVAPDRIVFLPAWDPAIDRLGSTAARRAWTAHRRIHVDAATLGVTPEAIFGAHNAVDYSAGRWRAALYASSAEWPIVQPEHERWKVRLPREGRLLKFVGLGRFGEAARRRARALAERGLGLEPGDLRQGFLDLPFVAGDPWTPADGDPAIVGRYVARVAAAFPAAAAVDPDPLFDMIVTNVQEIAGVVPSDLPHALGELRGLLAAAPAAAIDGRMLPHEWIASGSGAVKVDALDHHCDHFYPGLQHAGWDLAAAVVEFGWSPDRSGQLLAAYERHSADPLGRPLLPLYTLAYAAFRAGYFTLAGSPGAAARYSQCALNAAACLSASSKSPRKQMARSSMNT